MLIVDFSNLSLPALEFTPLEFETSMSSPEREKHLALEFTPLEFETAKGGFYDPAGSY